MIYGYARVSTDDQDLSNQREALLAAGAGFVFEEQVSGAVERIERGWKKRRRRLARAIRFLSPRLVQLARSTRDLLNILEEIVKALPTNGLIPPPRTAG